MKATQHILSFLFTLILAIPCSANDFEKKLPEVAPNIIFILVDDMGWKDPPDDPDKQGREFSERGEYDEEEFQQPGYECLNN